MDDKAEIIEKYTQNLSAGMREYLAKNVWRQGLPIIEQTNKLSEEQTSTLETEVVLILVGIENYSDLKKNIGNNVLGISPETVENITNDIEKNIFFEIKPLLEEIEKKNNAPEVVTEENLNKENVLKDIENPTPTKPIIQNPAGKNPILDAQHNLPEQERKILISSAAVPSRGPLLNNIKTGFTPPTTPMPVNKSFISPIVAPIRQEPITPQPISQPQQPVQTPKPAQPPIQPAPDKYTVDPYREPAE